MISYIASEQTITININGNPRLIKIKSKDHRNYIIRLLTECQKDESAENLEELWIALTPYKRVAHKVDGRIEYVEDLGKLFVKGIERPLPEVLQKRIMSFLDDELPIDALIKFWENCQLNPEFRAIEELYLFLEHNGLPITSDGCFVSYKKVNKVDHTSEAPEEFAGLYFDKAGNCRGAKGLFVGGELKARFKAWLKNSNKEFKLVDNYTKTMNNSVGQIVSMARQAVDNDRNQTCSNGLHFASWDYASTYSGNTLIMVKVNPKDVVAIPSDYNNMKGRACEYEVIGIINEEIQMKHLAYD
jgi:hypothetical protein